MIELMIEHWTHLDGSNHYLWSIWQDGSRVGMGRGAATPEQAEREGRLWCDQALGCTPDRVTRL
ncbi:MAG: hypothetical protein ACOY3L_04705 [Pseudomonadota bacterium]